MACKEMFEKMREESKMHEELLNQKIKEGNDKLKGILQKIKHEMEKILYATDELTGLIGAVAIMRPSKSVQDLEAKSVKKKFKNKKFAAGCSREVIQGGAEMLGWDLEKLMQDTLEAMRASEESVNKESAALN